MAFHLNNQQAAHIRSQGEQTYPHECCGFLLGTVKDGVRHLAALRPVDNAREDEARHNRYLISPDVFVKVEREARKSSCDILGFYHSHPDAPARPSQFDIDQAWPWYTYIIVAIEKGRSAAMTAWVLRNDRSGFDEQALIIEN